MKKLRSRNRKRKPSKPFDLFAIKPVGPLQTQAPEKYPRCFAAALVFPEAKPGQMVAPLVFTKQDLEDLRYLLGQEMSMPNRIKVLVPTIRAILRAAVMSKQ